MKKYRLFLIFLMSTFLKAESRLSQYFLAPTVDSFELFIKVSLAESIDIQNKVHYIYEYTLISTRPDAQPIRKFKIPWFARYEVPDLYHYPEGDTSYSKLGYSTIPKRASWIRLHLSPLDTIPGFVFITRQLPDISYWYAEGEPVDTFLYVPIVFGEEYEDTLRKYYYHKTPFGPGKYGRTVGPGPKPPMKSSWQWGHYPDSAFIHLRDRLSKCKEQGWVSEHAYDQIYRIIGHAWNHLENGRLEQSKRTLTRLMKTLERFKEHGDITDEAFYILYL